MNARELTQFSLRSAFDILEQVTADVTQEQAHWIPPGIANPIGALYWHTLSGADEVVHRWCVGQGPLHQRQGWRDRGVKAPVPEPEGAEGWLEHMRALQVNMPVLREYAAVLKEALDSWLGSLEPAELDRTIETPIGPYKMAEVLDLFVIWHINAHCGEISALKGCQGAKGYPF